MYIVSDLLKAVRFHKWHVNLKSKDTAIFREKRTAALKCLHFLFEGAGNCHSFAQFLT